MRVGYHGHSEDLGSDLVSGLARGDVLGRGDGASRSKGGQAAAGEQQARGNGLKELHGVCDGGGVHFFGCNGWMVESDVGETSFIACD